MVAGFVGVPGDLDALAVGSGVRVLSLHAVVSGLRLWSRLRLAAGRLDDVVGRVEGGAVAALLVAHELAVDDLRLAVVLVVLGLGDELILSGGGGHAGQQGDDKLKQQECGVM